jgi:hypothetical protein
MMSWPATPLPAQLNEERQGDKSDTCDKTDWERDPHGFV